MLQGQAQQFYSLMSFFLLIWFKIGNVSQLILFKRMLDCIAFPGFCLETRALLKSAYILIGLCVFKCYKPRIDC